MVILIVGIPYLISFKDTVWTSNISLWGSFGDYIGGTLGVSLALLSVVLIYMTYKDQKEHINKIEKSLQDQANRSEFVSLNYSLFSLLERKDKLLEKVKYVRLKNRHGYNKPYNGDVLYNGDNALNEMIQELRREIIKLGEEPKLEEIIECRLDTIEFSMGYLIPFVNCIYNCIDIIDTSGLNKMQKKHFYKIIKNTLTLNETLACLLILNSSDDNSDYNPPKKPEIYDIMVENNFLNNIDSKARSTLFIEWEEEPEEN